MKICSKCKIQKSEFSPHSRGQCIDCVRAYQRNYKKQGKGFESQKRYQQTEEFKNYQKKYHSLPKSKEYQRNYYLKNKYGMSEDIYQKMLLGQNKSCAICQRKHIGSKKMAVDHSHATGKIRGLLCNKCNHALGFFEDNTKRLKMAIHYLEKYGG